MDGWEVAEVTSLKKRTDEPVELVKPLQPVRVCANAKNLARALDLLLGENAGA